ncbi:hypothetical protein C7M84_013808 [Penaeus vannamei]|uniref:Uncharacterized protein n=1 Tax=Penaeus vannamei TaxID=6689 RepID=A0A3R7M622_PENVA|nr:hypothetical protein C7M84_013808 [Penaeus vannamei]
MTLLPPMANPSCPSTDLLSLYRGNRSGDRTRPCLTPLRMAFQSVWSDPSLAAAFCSQYNRCEVTDAWSASTTFKDHLDFSFSCAPESLKISFSGGALDGEFFHFQRSQKYVISTKNANTEHRLTGKSSNWTLTLSSTKGVQLIDTANKKTLPISLVKGRPGVCYQAQFEADTNIDFRFLHHAQPESSKPTAATEDLPPSDPPATSAETASTSTLFPSPDLGGSEVRSSEGRAERDAGLQFLMAALMFLM